MVCDWNEDGLEDLVVGERCIDNDGNAPFTLFLGTASGLTKAGLIEANGQTIYVCQNGWPWVDDWNNDGKKDLILGMERDEVNEYRGRVRVYLNIGANDDPEFSDHFDISAGGQLIDAPRTCPVFLDFDRDGKKDLLNGEGSGKVVFYKNIGTKEQPEFARGEDLKLSSGTVIDDGNPPRINFVDWDGDTDLDMLLCDYDGNVDLYENDSPVDIESKNYSESFAGYLQVQQIHGNSLMIINNRGTTDETTLTIYKLNGKKVLVNKFYGSFIWKNTGHPNGIYIIQAITTKGERQTIKYLNK